MALLSTTRRELICSICATAGTALLPSRLFATAPGPPLLTFFVIGDWGRDGHQHQQAVADLMAREAQRRNPAFIVSTGDNFYMFGVGSVNDGSWRSSFELVYHHDNITGLPWYPVFGNHDYGGSVAAQLHYRGPHNRWRMGGQRGERYYRADNPQADAAGVDLLLMDTVAWLGREGFPFNLLGDRIIPGLQREQAAWLSGQLAVPGPRFKLVFGHHGIYSIGPHGGAMRLTDLDALLRSAGATYIHGHDHCLFHIRRAGMDYICSGAGSQIRETYTGGPGHCVLNGFCEDGSDAIFPRWDGRILKSGFASFAVYEHRLDFEFISIGDRPEDSYRASIARPRG